MDWQGEIKPTYIDMPTDLRQALKTEAARRGKTIRVAVQEALEAWLKSESGTPDPDPDVEMLRRFKEIGSAEDIKFLRGNILVFLRDAERTRRRKGA